ncbi:MAG: peptidase T [Sarcina sp.]
MKKVEERFLEYVKIDTKSDDSTRVTPSTKGQLVLGEKLASELKEIGLEDVHIDEFGYVYATLRANTENKNIPTIGFVSHMDTAPDMSGKDVKPQIIENYQGQDIVLNEEFKVYLSPKSSPELKNYIGKTLITTDGTTLLGADDKAGLAEIMTAMEYLINHPEIKHGDIKVGFTPDEEIGEGADHFNVEEFAADFAYTMDGGAVGELEYENFNACTVKINITGRNVHPGYAKNKMINSIMVAHEFMTKLPLEEVPEKTSGYEGFVHVMDVKGCIESASMVAIIRDFFEDKYIARQELFRNIEKELNAKYGEGTVRVEIVESYKNMKEKVEPVMHVVDNAKKAMEMANIVPNVRPIRGGTDGARLSFMGLPTPNIFAGGENFHGRHEFVAIESMEKAVETIINIVKIYGEN